MSNNLRSQLLALALGLFVFAIGVSGAFAKPTITAPTVFLPWVAVGSPTYGGYVGGPIPSTGATYRIATGVTVPFGASGFAIAANAGPAYRMVWTAGTGPPAHHRYFGSIWTTGTFTSVIPGCISNSCPIAGHGSINGPINVAGGQRVDFDTDPGTAVIGLDFILSADPAYFDLFVDNVRDPNLVFFSSPSNPGGVSNVGVIPFQFTTH